MKYELALVIKPVSTEDVKEKVLPKVESNVKELGGSIKMINPLGKRMLAYPMNKFKEGFYYFYDVELSSAKATEFRKALRLNGDVLRALLLKKEEV
jgi:small subunit ribosomal protein S6